MVTHFALLLFQRDDQGVILRHVYQNGVASRVWHRRLAGANLQLRRSGRGSERVRFALGDATVDVIVDDDDFELPLVSFLPGLDLGALEPDRAWLEPDFVDLARGVLKCAVQIFVLRLGSRTILVDTCIWPAQGPAGDPGLGARGHRLARPAACRRNHSEAVDIVFCTHLHIDHVGWNTIAADGRWVPTFPNAPT